MRKSWFCTTLLTITLVGCISTQSTLPSSTLESTQTVAQHTTLLASTNAPTQITESASTIAATIPYSPISCTGSALVFVGHTVVDSSPVTGIYAVCANGDNLQEIIQLQPDLDIVGLTVSPDRSRIAFAKITMMGASTEIDILDLSDGGWQKLISVDYLLRDLAWSPDGQFLLLVSSEKNPMTDVGALDIDTRTLSTLVNGESINSKFAIEFYDPAWSPDGHSIVFRSYHYGDTQQIYTTEHFGKIQCDTTTRRCTAGAIREAGWQPTPDERLSWSVATNQIATLYATNSTEGRRDIIDLRDSEGQLIRRIDLHEVSPGIKVTRLSAPALSNDGEKVAFIGDDGSGRKIFILNLGNMQITSLDEIVDIDVGEIRWSD